MNESRIEALLEQMSLAQKIGQMTQSERLEATPEDVRDYHLGSILSGGGSHPEGNQVADWLKMADEFWEASMDDSPGRLPVPLLYGVDAIHGNNNVKGATIFPHNMALGAGFDAGLLARIADATAKEVLATGVDWTFAPTLAVAQNLHWGRTYESVSSQTDMVRQYAAAFIPALQANLPEDGVIGCAKHWVGDGGTTDGIDQGETTLAWSEFERIHVAPYYAAIDAGVLSIMVSFNSWNGDKCHGHRYLVTEVLKERMGFKGLVVSDWDGIDYLSDDYNTAIRQSVNAGIDMFMVPAQWREFITGLTAEVQAGRVSMTRIDDAVRRILRTKMAAGLFEKPRPSERKWSGSDTFGSQAHRAIAREAVARSLTLLKNEDDILPLAPNLRILVAGKNADNIGHQCGGFSLSWQGESGNDTIKGTSIWEGLSEVAPSAELSTDGQAADAAKHDVAVVVIGEKPYAEGMGDIRDGEDVVTKAGSMIRGSLKVLGPYGRSLLLSDLHPEDLACLQTISAAGVPIVTVMVSGRPLVVDKEMALSSAFVAAWLPGSEGAGVADVLFAEQPMTGSLSFDWPGSSSTDTAGPYETRFAVGYGLGYGQG